MLINTKLQKLTINLPIAKETMHLFDYTFAINDYLAFTH